jgi:carbon storage regulator
MGRASPVRWMFIIARRKGQRIAIGEDIEVVVTELSRNTVKLGIVAPRSCLIMRSELKESVAQANREAIAANLPGAGAESPVAVDALGPPDTRLASASMLLRTAVSHLAPTDVNLAATGVSTGAR